MRERILTRLGEQIAGSDKLTVAKRRERYGALATKPAFKRFLRQTPTGKLRIDRGAVATETKLDVGEGFDPFLTSASRKSPRALGCTAHGRSPRLG